MTPSSDRGEIGVVGTGRLGGALARWLAARGHVVRVLSRDARRAEALAEGGGPHAVAAPVGKEGYASLRPCEFVFLAVPDDAISAVCAAGAQAGAWRVGQLVVHGSGLVGLDALAAAGACGAGVACAHPVRTLGLGETDLSGTAWGLDGGEPALSALTGLLTGAGSARFFRLPADRARYHAACVFAANLVTVLVDEARSLAALSGLDAGQIDASLSALASAAADATRGTDAARALTGPAVRGDLGTLRAHLAVLPAGSEAGRIYRLLSANAVRMGERTGRLAPERAAQALALLEAGLA